MKITQKLKWKNLLKVAEYVEDELSFSTDVSEIRINKRHKDRLPVIERSIMLLAKESIIGVLMSLAIDKRIGKILDNKRLEVEIKIL